MKILEMESIVNADIILHWSMRFFTITKTTDAVIAPNVYFRAHLLGV